MAQAWLTHNILATKRQIEAFAFNITFVFSYNEV